MKDIKEDGQELVNIMDWGFVNPDTGMIRAQCDDTVTQGRYREPHRAGCFLCQLRLCLRF